MNRKVVISLLFVVIGAALITAYLYSHRQLNSSSLPVATSTANMSNATSTSASSTVATCLSDNEYANYPLNPKYDSAIKAPKTPLVVISIRDNSTQQEKFKFQIDNVSDNGHAIELHRCAVYVIREFNYDPNKSLQAPGYREELWRYGYDGKGDSLILLAEKLKEFISYFSPDFGVDPSESYVFLEQGSLGQSNYALVVKDLKTLRDVFVLSLVDILKKDSSVQPGDFAIGFFTSDGKYNWGELYDGAYDTAYYRIELGTWKVEVFPPPPNLPTGAERDFNPSGWLAYVDMTSFTGSSDMTQLIEDQARKAGELKNLWIYNLITKQDIKIASADPAQRFKPKWLSDTALQYTLSSGATTTYIIPNP
jgi:hypothetical protein